LRIEQTKIVSVDGIQSHIFLLSVRSEYFAANSKPGQFFNIKVSDNQFPLLRRPFSVCDIEGDKISFLFDVHGEGTKILSSKKAGDFLDILGPLGHGFTYDSYFDSAIMVGGGLGAAPFPLLTKILKGKKKLFTFIGARNAKELIRFGLDEPIVSTDDGSIGFKGNVVELIKSQIGQIPGIKKIFACGPNPMLKALTDWANLVGIETEVSVECAMACGIGLCQGCPVEKSDKSGYLLVCKDGPVFTSQEVMI